MDSCPECVSVQMERKPDVTKSYELRGEKAEWLAPYWVCPKCGLGCEGEPTDGSYIVAMERMYCRVIRKLEARLAAYE